MLDAAVDTCFWPLYEVVDGHYSLTYEPAAVQPVMRWLAGQQRFAHLLRPENAQLVTEIQASVDRDWAALRARCATGRARTSHRPERSCVMGAEPQLRERFVYDFDEPCEGGRALLGGKGLGLAEMTQLGLPVPRGFTITTEACLRTMRDGRAPDEPRRRDRLSTSRGSSSVTGKRFGDGRQPAAALRPLRRADLDARDDGDDPEPRPEPRRWRKPWRGRRATAASCSTPTGG